jgi:hypothetical protein
MDMTTKYRLAVLSKLPKLRTLDVDDVTIKVGAMARNKPEINAPFMHCANL